MVSGENAASRDSNSRKDAASIERPNVAAGASHTSEPSSAPNSAGSAKKKAKKRTKKKKPGKPADELPTANKAAPPIPMKLHPSTELAGLPPGLKAKRRTVKRGQSSGSGTTPNDTVLAPTSKAPVKRGQIAASLRKARENIPQQSSNEPVSDIFMKSSQRTSNTVPVPDLFLKPEEVNALKSKSLNSRPKAKELDRSNRSGLESSPMKASTGIIGAGSLVGEKIGNNVYPGIYRELSSLQPVVCDVENTEIQEYWEQLSDAERKEFVNISKDTLFAHIHQERHSCDCPSCSSKQEAVEEELETIYAINEPGLRKFADILQSVGKTNVVEGVRQYFMEMLGNDYPDIFWSRPDFHGLVRDKRSRSKASKNSNPHQVELPDAYQRGSTAQRQSARTFLSRLHKSSQLLPSEFGDSNSQPESADQEFEEQLSESNDDDDDNEEENSHVYPPKEKAAELNLRLMKQRLLNLKATASGDNKSQSELLRELGKQMAELSAMTEEFTLDSSSAENLAMPDKAMGMLSWINMFCESEGITTDQISLLSRVFSSELIKQAPGNVKEAFSHFLKDIQDNKGQNFLSMLESTSDQLQADIIQTSANEAASKMAQYYKEVQGTNSNEEFDLNVRVDAPQFVTNGNVSEHPNGQELIVDEVYSEPEYGDSELEDFTDEGLDEEEEDDDEEEEEDDGKQAVDNAENDAEIDDDDEDDDDDDFDDYVDSVEDLVEVNGNDSIGEEDIALLEEQEKKRRMQVSWYLHFLYSRILEQRIIKAYREYLTRKRQQSLLDELAEEEAKAKAEAARKQKDKDKKKTKKLAARLQREEEAQRKAAEAKKKADMAREKENAIRLQQLAMDRAKQEARCRKIEERMAQLALESSKKADSDKSTGSGSNDTSTRPANTRNNSSNSKASAKNAGNATVSTSTPTSSQASKPKKEQKAEKNKEKDIKGDNKVDSKTNSKADSKIEHRAEIKADSKSKKDARPNETTSDKHQKTKLDRKVLSDNDGEKDKSLTQKSKETTRPSSQGTNIPAYIHSPAFTPVAHQQSQQPSTIGAPMFGSPLSKPTMSTQLSQPVIPGSRPLGSSMPVPPTLDDLSGLPSNLGAVGVTSMVPSLGMKVPAGRPFSSGLSSSLNAAGNAASSMLNPQPHLITSDITTNQPSTNSSIPISSDLASNNGGTPLNQSLHAGHDLASNFGMLPNAFTGSKPNGVAGLANHNNNPAGISIGAGVSMKNMNSQHLKQPHLPGQANFPQYTATSSLWSMGNTGSSQTSGWSRSPWDNSSHLKSDKIIPPHTSQPTQRSTNSLWASSIPSGEPAASTRDITNAAKTCYSELQHLCVDGYLPSQVLYHAAQKKSGLRFSQNELYKACAQLPSFECLRDDVGLITHIKI